MAHRSAYLRQGRAVRLGSAVLFVVLLGAPVSGRQAAHGSPPLASLGGAHPLSLTRDRPSRPGPGGLCASLAAAAGMVRRAGRPSAASDSPALEEVGLALIGLAAVARPAYPAILQVLEDGAARFRDRKRAQVTALYFTCFGIYLLIALIFVTYWKRARRDLPVLAVGVLAAVMAAHTVAISGSLPFVFPDVVDVRIGATVETVSYLLLSGVIAFMLWAFFPESFRPRASDWIGRLNTIVAGAAVACSFAFAGMALLPGDHGAILAASRWVTVVLMIVAAALGIESVQTDRVFGEITATGLGLLIAGSIHDALFAGVGAAGGPYLVTFALLGFVLLQSYVVLRRSAESTQMAQMSSRLLRREVETRTKELRAASVTAQNANMAKTEFVTAVTHELRTPLTSLLGYVHLIREEVRGELTPEKREFFDSLEMSAQRLLNLVNNLLDLAKIESGHIDITLEKVDVAAFVQNVRGQLYPMAHEKHLYLRTEVNVADMCIVTDRQWLNVVLLNLVSNAVKYTDEGGVTIRVDEARLGDRTAVSIKVIDTGPGISADFLPRLYQRFTREQRARDHAPMGSGLGLPIARELLEHLGGEISVESEEGAGSTFAIVLPAAGPPGQA